MSSPSIADIAVVGGPIGPHPHLFTTHAVTAHNKREGRWRTLQRPSDVVIPYFLWNLGLVPKCVG